MTRSKKKTKKSKVRTCRKCGCTDMNCAGCVERTGERCHWVGIDLCSACAPITAATHRMRIKAAGGCLTPKASLFFVPGGRPYINIDSAGGDYLGTIPCTLPVIRKLASMIKALEAAYTP